MNSLHRVPLYLILVGIMPATSFAQTGTITTYAGQVLPINGLPAATQFLGDPGCVVVADANGGFYLTSGIQVYRVSGDGLIFTVAGNGISGEYSGDGGAATSAGLMPFSMTLDSAGNLFIAEYYNNRVRKVTPSGVISTIAGNGTPGFAGDGGPAISAQVENPAGIAVDTGGNLFISDSGNNRIRKVTPNGVISTLAGNGTPGFAGDGGPAISAQLTKPYGIAVDVAGNLFIADYGNSRVRRVTPDGVINTFAGNGTAGFSGDGGTATSAGLSFPSGVAVDAGGNLFVADTANNRIRKVSQGGMITTVAGNGVAGFAGDGGAATSAELSRPAGVSVDGNANLLIADTGNGRIRRVSTGGAISSVAGTVPRFSSLDGIPATSASLAVNGVAVDAAGNVFIASLQKVRKVAPGGTISTVYAKAFTSHGDFFSLVDVAADASGNIFISDIGDYQSDYEDSRVYKVAANGVVTTYAGGFSGFGGDGGLATSARLSFPDGLAVDSSGNLFIADTANNRVRRVSANGTISTVAGNGVAGFAGDGGPAISAQIRPSGIALDASGNLFIAEPANHRIRKVTSNGTISTVAGIGSPGYSGDGGPATSAQLSSPAGVAVDTAGNIFIADTGNSSIRKVTPAGVISTIAGSGSAGYGGDGGLATKARLNQPRRVAVSSTGDLFIADTNNNRIRKVSFGPAALNEVAATKGDFNGDGKTDILWHDTTGNVSMWLMDGFTVLDNRPVANVWTGWFIAGVGDFNKDGKSDILWRNTSGDVSIWLMDGAVITHYHGLGNIWTGWSIAGVGDFDGDGKADILWRSTSGDVAIWLMDGASVSSYREIANIWNGWAIVGVADFNRDGKADILWRDTAGNVAIWLMNGFNVISRADIGNVPVSSTIIGLGESNGDSKADIFWRDASGNVSLWLINGNVVALNTSLANIWTGWSTDGVGDFNGDQRADILWRGPSGEVVMWNMNAFIINFRNIAAP